MGWWGGWWSKNKARNSERDTRQKGLNLRTEDTGTPTRAARQETKTMKSDENDEGSRAEDGGREY